MGSAKGLRRISAGICNPCREPRSCFQVLLARFSIDTRVKCTATTHADAYGAGQTISLIIRIITESDGRQGRNPEGIEVIDVIRDALLDRVPSQINAIRIQEPCMHGRRCYSLFRRA